VDGDGEPLGAALGAADGAADGEPDGDADGEPDGGAAGVTSGGPRSTDGAAVGGTLGTWPSPPDVAHAEATMRTLMRVSATRERWRIVCIAVWAPGDGLSNISLARSRRRRMTRT
jgi:hypothetical protein